jgi:hypothetical protein
MVQGLKMAAMGRMQFDLGQSPNQLNRVDAVAAGSASVMSGVDNGIFMIEWTRLL